MDADAIREITGLGRCEAAVGLIELDGGIAGGQEGRKPFKFTEEIDDWVERVGDGDGDDTRT